jgi:uncharacterized membrane protein
MARNDDFDPFTDDNSNWIFGIFYFNREDKRLFVPKQKPSIGWTINFANPWSVLSLICACTAFGLLGYFASKFGK